MANGRNTWGRTPASVSAKWYAQNAPALNQAVTEAFIGYTPVASRARTAAILGRPEDIAAIREHWTLKATVTVNERKCIAGMKVEAFDANTGIRYDYDCEYGMRPEFAAECAALINGTGAAQPAQAVNWNSEAAR